MSKALALQPEGCEFDPPESMWRYRGWWWVCTYNPSSGKVETGPSLKLNLVSLTCGLQTNGIPCLTGVDNNPDNSQGYPLTDKHFPHIHMYMYVHPDNNGTRLILWWHPNTMLLNAQGIIKQLVYWYMTLLQICFKVFQVCVTKHDSFVFGGNIACQKVKIRSVILSICSVLTHKEINNFIGFIWNLMVVDIFYI